MTAGDSLPKRIAVETVPSSQDNIRESMVTFSDANKADDNNFKGSVTLYDAKPGGAASPFGSSISTTRTVVVDATKHLESHQGSTSSGKLIPGVKDVTSAVHDVVKHAKHCVRMFRVDNEIFEVNEEQLDRVRMSKFEFGGKATSTTRRYHVYHY
jgi:hypothetical protein